MAEDVRRKLAIPAERLDEISAVLLDPESQVINEFLEVVAKYGSPPEINELARKAGQLQILLDKVRDTKPEFLKDLEWLEDQRVKQSFISISDYRQKVLGAKADQIEFNEDYPVTLEVSAAQYFPWIVLAARRAIDRRAVPSISCRAPSCSTGRG